MKNLLFVLCLLVSLNTNAAITVVSDLDDTIKITQSGGSASDIIGDDVFTGMPELFKGMREYSDDLFIVSASPKFMRKVIASTLKKRAIEHEGLVLRSSLTESKFNYKVREIKKIMDNSTDDFILIGDDLGEDPEIYLELKNQYGPRILDIYIHVVNGRIIDPEIIAYWTSFELFLRELEAGRMKTEWMDDIYTKLRSPKEQESIFPKKADCPTDANLWEWQTRTIFATEARDLIERFTAFCQARRSDNNLL